MIYRYYREKFHVNHFWELNVKQVYSRDVWSVYWGMVKGQECAVLLGLFFL